MDLYAIYDPIVENGEEACGGAWCFAADDDTHAYLVFASPHLAASFLQEWDSPGEHHIVPVEELGDHYEELTNDVNYFLVLSSATEIDQLMREGEHFPYQHCLFPRRRTQWLH